MKSFIVKLVLLISLVPFAESYSQAIHTLTNVKIDAPGSTISSNYFFCQSCGQKNSNSNSFCTGCGVKLHKFVPATPKPGALFVTSVPNGASIWIDGVSTGQSTPYLFEIVSSGSHEIVLKKEKFANTSKNVKIEPSIKYSYSENLNKALYRPIIATGDDTADYKSKAMKRKVRNRYYNNNLRRYSNRGLWYAWGATVFGSLVMGDASFGTTIIPVVGPFISMARIEADPDKVYMPAGRELLLVSGITQATLSLVYIYSLLKPPKNDLYSIGLDFEDGNSVLKYSMRF